MRGQQARQPAITSATQRAKRRRKLAQDSQIQWLTVWPLSQLNIGLPEVWACKAAAAAGRRSANRSRFTWIPGHILDYDGRRHQLELENEQVVWLDLTRRKFRLLEEVLDSDDDVAAGESCEMGEMGGAGGGGLEPAELEEEGDSDAVHARLLQGDGDSAREGGGAGAGAGSGARSGASGGVESGAGSQAEPQTTVWSFGPFRFEFKAT